MKKYILAIDQGTTSTKGLLFDEKINIIEECSFKIEQFYPKEGFVEQDPIEIYKSTLTVINDILSCVDPSDVKGISISNQRETTVVWDKSTGEPVYNAIVWQSRQTEEITSRFEMYEDMIKAKTGLKVDPYFSATKIRYILEHIEDGQGRAERGELLFGTIDTWLVYKLTNNHYTDTSNASRTLLYNIFDNEWDEELLKLFNIPKIMLPTVKNSSDDYGMTRFNISINCVIGDQQAATFGQLCFNRNSIKATYGTGLFIIANTGKEPIVNNHGLLTTVLWTINNETYYALEGTVFIAASAMEWFKDSVHLFKDDSEIKRLLASANNDSNLVVIPTFVGLATPYWNSNVQGAMYGITRGTTDGDIVKSTIESIACQCYDVISIMNKYLDKDDYVFKVDGGMASNNYLLEFQSNLLQKEVKRPKITQTTALGGALIAGLYTGVYEDFDQIKDLVKVDYIFEPQKDVSDVYKRYQKAIATTISYHEDNE